MKMLRRVLLGAVAAAAMLPLADMASAQEKTVGVSWRHFQEERWKIDEAGIKEVLEKAGFGYVGVDAQADPQKQLADIEGLIAQGVDVLIILPQDSAAALPAFEAAKAAGIPTITYDIPTDFPDALFVSFDNIAVGRLMAEAMVKAQPKGNWALIEGDPLMPIVDLFRAGQMQVVQPLVDKGDITIVAQQGIENWKPDVAQTTMDQILTKTDNKVDAVLAMNDGMSGGAAAALAAQGLLGKVALSGQDGDIAALNRIAKGEATVTVWKNARKLGEAAGAAAVEMANGTPAAKVTGAAMGKTMSGKDQPAILLEPIAITRDNLNLVIDSGWATKEQVCQGVTTNPPPACQ
ncbi:MAG: substrate-binding domain-containing protein [Geminicoccaceae bacterium]